MNVLKKDKQALVVAMLAEGSGIRAVERVTKVHRDTVLRLLVRVGERCDELTREYMQGFASTPWSLTKHGRSVF